MENFGAVDDGVNGYISRDRERCWASNAILAINFTGYKTSVLVHVDPEESDETKLSTHEP